MALTQVSTDGIKDTTIATADIAADAVTGAKIADDAVGAEHIEVLDAALQFGDSVKAQFGTGNDLEIFHDGSHSKIKQVGTGNLNLYADTFKIVDNSNGDNMINANSDGNVELYYNNVKRLETTSTGNTSTGNINVSAGHVYLDDNYKFKCGAGEDLNIYHNGTDSFIQNITGDLKLFVGTEQALIAKPNGAVELYYDDAKRLSTWSDSVNIYGDEGADAILHMYADEGDDNADKWRLRSDSAASNFLLENYAQGQWEKSIECQGDGNVELYYDNSKKFQTTSTGIKVESGAAATFHLTSNPSYSASIEFGDTDDDDEAEIWYDNYSKALSFRTSESADLVFYRDGTEKTRITSSGMEISGSSNTLKVTHTGGSCVVLERNSKQLTFNANYGAQDTYSTFNVGSGMGYKFYLNGSPYITINSSGVLSGDLNDTSDEKKKKNITSIPDGAIAKIKQLRPVNFNWKNPLNTADQSGFIAQEVKTVIPDLVSGEEYDEAKGDIGYAINTTGVVAHLTKALQEAITKIETLETKVAALEAA